MYEKVLKVKGTARGLFAKKLSLKEARPIQTAEISPSL